MYKVTTPKGRELSRHDSIESARAAVAGTCNVLHYSAKARREYTPQARLASAPVPYISFMPLGNDAIDTGIDDTHALLSDADMGANDNA